MDKIILVEINVRSYLSSGKVRAAQERINEYIRENCLDVIENTKPPAMLGRIE